MLLDCSSCAEPTVHCFVTVYSQDVPALFGCNRQRFRTRCLQAVSLLGMLGPEVFSDEAGEKLAFLHVSLSVSEAAVEPLSDPPEVSEAFFQTNLTIPIVLVNVILVGTAG